MARTEHEKELDHKACLIRDELKAKGIKPIELLENSNQELIDKMRANPERYVYTQGYLLDGALYQYLTEYVDIVDKIWYQFTFIE